MFITNLKGLFYIILQAQAHGPVLSGSFSIVVMKRETVQESETILFTFHWAKQII